MLTDQCGCDFNFWDIFCNIWEVSFCPLSMPDTNSRHITFCLCPGFPLFCIASALEVLRHANRFWQDSFYSWSFLCEDNQPIQSNNGLWLVPNTEIESARTPDIAFVIAGFNPSQLKVPKLTNWLQAQASAGHTIGGISNGAFLLAQAKLLDGYAATVHWEDFASFCALHANVRSRYQRFLIDRDRMTCSGGTSTLDLFLEIVRKDLGDDLSMDVSRQMLLQEYTQSGNVEWDSIFDGSRHYSLRVQRALSLIDGGTEQRLNVRELAAQVGLSRRQLLRLFRREIGKTPAQVLIQRRLERARSLVIHSHLPLAVVSTAVGFSSQSHLTGSYKKHFGTTPAEHRRTHQLRG